MKQSFGLGSIVVTLASGIACVVIACGGSTEDSAIVSPAGSDAGGGSTSSGATSSSGTTTSSGGSSGGSSGASGATDSGTTDSGGTSSGDSGGGGTGATPNAIACGTATCNAATQKCCTTFQQGSGVTSACIAAADECQGAQQRCDDKADCPSNQVCCAGGGGGGGGGGGTGGATCQAACGEGSFQLCKAANECTAGTCQTYTCFGRQVSLCQKPQFGCQ